jgi:thiol:disulfide interchange protein DsbD
MAKIDVGWHIYSQTQPKDAIAVPTSIKFTKNPLMSLNGKLKEVGNLERHTEKTLGITQNQFSDTVDFVQVIKMNRKAKTNASGTIEFQVCTDEKCLPPKTIHFSIPIQ